MVLAAANSETGMTRNSWDNESWLPKNARCIKANRPACHTVLYVESTCLRFSCIEYGTEEIADRQRGFFHMFPLQLMPHQVVSLMICHQSVPSNLKNFPQVLVPLGLWMMQHPECWVPGVLQLVVDGVHGGTATASCTGWSPGNAVSF